MRPITLRPLALVGIAVLALSGCASKKDPTADGMTTATGLGTFGPSSPAGNGNGNGVGAGIGSTGAFADGSGTGFGVEPVVAGGIGSGAGSGAGSYGSTPSGGINGSALGGIGQGAGTSGYVEQGGYGANNGLVDGGIISAAPQYTDGTVYTDNSTYAASDATLGGAIQPYDNTLFDDSGAMSNGSTDGSQYTTYSDQGGSAALGGYSFPGDNGQPSYFATQVGNRILFETDSSTLTDGARDTLRRQAAWLQLHPEHSVILEGHADERGTREYNLALGARRADTARSYMSSLGVIASRLRTVSYGKERPLSLGSNSNDWAKNRRVDTALSNGANF